MSNRPCAVRSAIAIILLSGCVASNDAPEQWSAETTIDSTPAGAQIVWFRARTPEQPGGPVELGDAPVRWQVSRGLIGPEETVTLVAFKPGHGRARVVVPVERLRTGEPVVLDVPQFAALRVHSDPIATFSLTDEDGVRVADQRYTPTRVDELTPGTYTLRVDRDGYAPFEGQVTVRPGEQARSDLGLEALPAPPDGEPRTSIRPGTVEGTDADLFYAAVVAEMRSVAGCYDRALATDPAATGEIHVALLLNLGFGNVEGAEVLRTEIASPDALDCVQRRLRRVTFPAGAEGTGRAELTVRFHRIPR